MIKEYYAAHQTEKAEEAVAKEVMVSTLNAVGGSLLVETSNHHEGTIFNTH